MRWFFLLAGLMLAPSAWGIPPEPPHQHDSWQPPATSLSPVLVSAVQELFDEGLSDPRGCEFHEITIASPEYDQVTTGWVLDLKATPAFAVGWDGLVHQLKSIGPPLDLGHEFTTRNVAVTYAAPDERWAWNDYSNDITGIQPLKAALLLRVGRTDLAEAFWKRDFAGSSLERGDPFVRMSILWLASQMHRVSNDFFRAKDADALAEGRDLDHRHQLAEAAAAQRGIAKATGTTLYFTGLDLLAPIITDLDRRAKEPPYTEVAVSNLPAAGPERTRALIRDLEQAADQQEMNPGQTDVFGDPVVQLLIRQGDEAVERLIDCWENDTRLTRSRFTANMGTMGPMIGVDEPAYLALCAILDHPFYFDDADSDYIGGRAARDPRDEHPREMTLADRRVLGTKMRAYWNSVKGMTLPERWFAVLQDDKAGVPAWQKAMSSLTSSSSQRSVSFGLFGGTEGWGWPYQPGETQGESLRGRTNPSLSDLLLKRYRTMLADASVGNNELGALLLGIMNWDGKAHLTEVADFQRQLRHRPDGQSPFWTISAPDAQNLLFERRLGAGDRPALGEYADWIAGMSPKDINGGDNAVRYFHVLWHHAENPVMKAVAGKLFATNGKWNPIPNALIETPLLGVGEFRAAVVDGLGDKSDAGDLTYNGGSVSYRFTRTGETSTESPGPAAPPKPGTTVKIRVCDAYAARLARIGGMPSFDFSWPVEKRNEAIGRDRAFFSQYGADFRAKQDDAYGEWLVSDVPIATFSLPPLDHAATPADVRAGSAIFSLPGDARPVTLPSHPLGPIWQAEEVRENGAWHRYYGIIEAGKPTKVPAEKMTFGPDNSATSVAPGLRGAVADIRSPRPPFTAGMGTFGTQALSTSDPCLLDLTLHNEHGLDQPVPPEFIVPVGAKATLPPGVTLEISYSPKVPAYMTRITNFPFDPGTFQTVALRSEVKVSSGQPGTATIGPDQDYHVLHANLGDFVELKAGTYKVKVLLHPEGKTQIELAPVQFSMANYGR